MDARRFDRLTRALSQPGTRRGLLGLLGTLPVLGGLVALLDPDETDAKGRRKRHKKPHHHRKKTGNRSGNQKKRRCNPESKTKTCSGTCGSVKNNCKKIVDCGSCDCPEPCAECFTCQGEAGKPARCVPRDAGTPCGDDATCEHGTVTPQGSCDGSGQCDPGDPFSCDPYRHCDGSACAQTCANDDDCVNGSFCDQDHCVGDGDNGDPCTHGGQCQSGFCADHVCCDSACDGACFACAVAGSLGECVVDPDRQGEPCGSDGQICQPDGACACSGNSCGACRTCEGDGSCAACSGCCDGETCVSECGDCQVCDEGACTGCPDCCDTAGVCQDGVTKAACGSSGTCDVCTGREECQNQQCVCVPDCTGKECGTDGCTGQCGQCIGSFEICLNGSCELCGFIGDPCCAGNSCRPFGSFNSVCVNGSCVSCGGFGQRCCANNSCNDGRTCFNNTCV